MDYGIEAVRQKFGREVAERILLWPRLAEMWARICYGDDEHTGYFTSRARAQAEHNVAKAKRDKEYALAQAEFVVRLHAGEDMLRMPNIQRERERMLTKDEPMPSDVGHWCLRTKSWSPEVQDGCCERVKEKPATFFRDMLARLAAKDERLMKVLSDLEEKSVSPKAGGDR